MGRFDGVHNLLPEGRSLPCALTQPYRPFGVARFAVANGYRCAIRRPATLMTLAAQVFVSNGNLGILQLR